MGGDLWESSSSYFESLVALWASDTADEHKHTSTHSPMQEAGHGACCLIHVWILCLSPVIFKGGSQATISQRLQRVLKAGRVNISQEQTLVQSTILHFLQCDAKVREDQIVALEYMKMGGNSNNS